MNNYLKWKKVNLCSTWSILRTGHAICLTHLVELCEVYWTMNRNCYSIANLYWQISMEHWVANHQAERRVSELNCFDIFVELSFISRKNDYALLSVPILDHVISIHYKVLLLSCWGCVSIKVKSYSVVLIHANCVTECFVTSCHL